ncbi:Rna-binding protein [Cardiosporidium cionae]|uniref:Rna-binding protein n=1 Tax=Cardiosporidium cionae TaxID=476202 RepID=A0ABQ7J4W4_9APIC|nr:Rna-binding protein [Cardiosporidium cionae]|eukprot:KAF8819028.1 Rna-binding protein [Cardiosporidium cionae]
MATYRIESITKLSERELKSEAKRIASSHSANENSLSSWHSQYKNSAYIFIGGLSYRLSEGDVIIVFSQWGEPVDVHIVRDKQTGASKGFAFLAYRDQRSTVLAVDNANGMDLLGRRIRVDHVENFRAPKKFSESGEVDEDGNPKTVDYNATGAEGAGIGKYNVTEHCRALIKPSNTIKKNVASSTNDKEISKSSSLLDEDDIWARKFEELTKTTNQADLERFSHGKKIVSGKQKKQRKKHKRHRTHSHDTHRSHSSDSADFNRQQQSTKEH